MIRRKIPKGTPIENYTDEEIKNIETWINNYPRRLLDGKSSSHLFNEQIELIKKEIELEKQIE